MAQRKAGAIPDTLLLLEHPHVYTLGRNARQENMLVSAEFLASRGAEIFHTDRGGDVTYHGPGQLVGYPILDLTQHRRDISWYMRSLEEVFIRVAGEYGIEAGRCPGRGGRVGGKRQAGCDGRALIALGHFAWFCVQREHRLALLRLDRPLRPARQGSDLAGQVTRRQGEYGSRGRSGVVEQFGVVFGVEVNEYVNREQLPGAPRESRKLSAATLERMLYYLKLTRESEWRIENVLYRQGKIVGGVYVGRGQEAIGVGAALTMRDGDVTLPCHRDFSVFLIRGFSLPDIFANWLGRADSPNRGRDNTIHIGSMKLGIIPIISPLGATAPVACGVAMVMKQRGNGNIAMVHFGEGTTSLGNVHEAMNFSAVRKLPVVFICNNNQYAYSTPADQQFAVKSLAVRGAAYGMPGESVDGTDVLAVYDAVERAAA